jgi:hypothetical protein
MGDDYLRKTLSLDFPQSPSDSYSKVFSYDGAEVDGSEGLVLETVYNYLKEEFGSNKYDIDVDLSGYTSAFTVQENSWNVLGVEVDRDGGVEWSNGTTVETDTHEVKIEYDPDSAFGEPEVDELSETLRDLEYSSEGALEEAWYKISGRLGFEKIFGS